MSSQAMWSFGRAHAPAGKRGALRSRTFRLGFAVASEAVYGEVCDEEGSTSYVGTPLIDLLFAVRSLTTRMAAAKGLLSSETRTESLRQEAIPLAKVMINSWVLGSGAA